VPDSLNSLAPGLNCELLSDTLYPNEACVATEDLVAALRIVCTQSGVRILENAAAKSIEAGPDQVLVSTPRERIAARYLVIAAGAWSSQIQFNVGGMPVSIPVSFPVKEHLAGYRLSPAP
jgi:glycine/D-amino acid oxidase-like deaminating enzyme